MTDETPDGLHRNQYAAHLLEEVLGWPSKGNLELMADCLLSISKSRHISIKQAHGYMERAIRLAREQCIEIDGHWFRNGEYTKMRPVQKEVVPEWKSPSPAEWAKIKADQQSYFNSPEYKEISARIAKAFELPLTSERRKELREQVAKIQETAK